MASAVSLGGRPRSDCGRGMTKTGCARRVHAFQRVARARCSRNGCESFAGVLVPLQVVRTRSDAGDVGTAVAVEVGNCASGRRNAAAIQNLACPVAGREAVKINRMRSAAKARYYLVVSVAVEIGGIDIVGVEQRTVDHFALPAAF